MKLALAMLFTFAVSTTAAADPVALDYQAHGDGCIDAGQFADEVAAKLGFVPWTTSAAATIYVRVDRDRDHYTGAFRNRDGSSKIIDAASCSAVTDSLAMTVAIALDGRDEHPPATVTPAPALAATPDNTLPVTFESADRSAIAIALRAGTEYGTTSKGVAVSGSYYTDLCTTPCTARVLLGERALAFAGDGVRGHYELDVERPLTITATRKRRTTTRGAVFAAGLLSALGGATAIDRDSASFEHGGATSALGTLAITVGVLAMILGPNIPDTYTYATAPTR